MIAADSSDWSLVSIFFSNYFDEWWGGNYSDSLDIDNADN